MDRHFKIGTEDWQTLPFQVEIANALANDDIRTIDWPKCAQIGYTKLLTGAAGYFTEHKHRNVIIYQPTKGDAESYCQEEIDPMFESVDVCADALARGKKGKTGDKLSLKNVAGALLHILGGHSERAYRRLTADVVIYDDLDGFLRDISGNDPVSLGDDRLTVSLYPKSIRGSTPRKKGDSLIFDEVERAAFVLQYHVFCPHCEIAQTFVFAQFRWEHRDPRTVHYVCPHCEEHWFYRDIYDLLEGGYWGTLDGTLRVDDGNLVDAEGNPEPWPRHIAFWIWAAYSVFFSWEDLIHEWLDAQGDPRKLQKFTNTRLAEVYDEVGEEIEPETLETRAEDYIRVPDKVRGIYAGVDVQKGYLQYEIVGYGDGAESWGLEQDALYGDPTQPEVWDDLTERLKEPRYKEDGSALQVRRCAIDSGHLADHVYAYWKRKRGRVGPCELIVTKGASDDDGAHELVKAPHQRKTGKSKASVPLFMVGTHAGKTLLYHRLEETEPGPGYCHFPKTYGAEFYRQLTAEKKVTRKRRGRDYVVWIKQRTRNEALDCRVLSYVAVMINAPSWIHNKQTQPQTEDVDRRTEKPKTLNPFEVPLRRLRRGRRGFINSWR